ncbi:hypothetical protein [Thalassotalea sp. PLHSN55]|uniref:hypothetical protein n=1 Tax=Thalassotalea sp. PLHSN55 TaxID=3435888 RepID=UPI003F872748
MKWLVVVAVLLCTSAFLIVLDDFQAQQVQVSFGHAANLTDKPITKILRVSSSGLNDDSNYSMDVESVYCGEKVCKVDPVTLHWDQFGRYQKLTLRSGITLEKGQGQAFEHADYRKLDRILSDRANSLQLFYKEELVAKNSGGNSVDAMSGATIAINKNDYVEGAIWTCFTLWHFANGEIVEKIRRHSGQSKSIKSLYQLARSTDEFLKLYALEQLTLKRAFDGESADILRHGINVNSQNYLMAFIRYIEQFNKADYQQQIVFLLEHDLLPVRLLALQSVLNNKAKTSSAFLHRISSQLSRDWQHQEVHLFVQILKSSHLDQQAINSLLAAKIEHLTIISARKLYWYLAEQTLSNDAQQKMHQFYQLHQHRL